MKKYFLPLLIAVAFITSCSDKFSFDPEVGDGNISSGSADFSKYVSLGNSLTSGYADGALYSSGQIGSYPNIIAGQMQLAGGGAFKQPLMPNDIGGFSNLGVSGKLTLQVVSGSLSPVASAAAATLDNVTASGPYQNLGVPGAKLVHLLAPGYGNTAGILAGTANPYFCRFATSTTTSVLADALVQNPTFVSLWIGNNDVLGFATTGGDGTNPITPAAGSLGVGFSTTYTYLADQIFPTGTTRKGIIANIPYVTSIPFFTTVPYNPLSPSLLGGASNINTLNSQLYTPVSQILTALGQGSRISPLSATSNNPLLIKDETLTNLAPQLTAALIANGVSAAQAGAIGAIFGQARQAKSDDLVLLTTRGVIGTAGVYPAPFDKYGITLPLEDKHILLSSEVASIIAATDAYNVTITSVANSKGLALYDAKAGMMALSSNSGITFNGTTYTENFVSGGAFSLDGVHPNGRGYAIIANGFIQAINAKYGSTLPYVNPNFYTGVTFP